MPDNQSNRFHRLTEETIAPTEGHQAKDEPLRLAYRFYTHFHPYLDELDHILNTKSIAGLLGEDTHYDGIGATGKPKLALSDEAFFKKYKPAPSPEQALERPHQRVFVNRKYPVNELDFSPKGAYSVYNWEIFFHVPFTIAVHLSKNQRYEESQRWFHYIFDPTDHSEGKTPERFWKVYPFQRTVIKKIEDLLDNLSTQIDPDLFQETVQSIRAWKDAPFRPHVIARYRHSAYMLKVVMAYLDNLIEWGDSLFRQDSGESINEAMQIYVLAANILGPRPQSIPKKGSMAPQTYASMREHLDALDNVRVDLELNGAFDQSPSPGPASDSGPLHTVSSIGKALYFCVPRNEKLLSYWDTVADRLFKIRNSLNLQGVFRQLPLFEPPIDPALLARATAAGLDVAAVLSGLNQPLPLVRFQFLIQKALELCQEVKALGSSLLAAMEREDNEALSLLRSKHERIVLGLVESVRYGQHQEAIKAREGLEQSLANAAQRYRYYERLLGKSESELQLPEIEPIDEQRLQDKALQATEPTLATREIAVDIVQNPEASTGGRKLSSHELGEILLSSKAQSSRETAMEWEMTGSALRLFPDTTIDGKPIGIGPGILFGLRYVAGYMSMLASAERGRADFLSHLAGLSAKMGSYARREQEWAFQSNLAAGEITLIYKQLRAAQLREAVAKLEWDNHKQQMVHAEEIEHFLNADGSEKNGKKTNKALHTWMKGEIRGLYSRCFQLAFDIAQKAERALQHELGNSELSFLRFDYMGGKEGLLTGEKLYLDIKRMELAYHEKNQREYELTKHVSLLQLDPMALLQLRSTGECTLALTEDLFDLDCPGHYFRRIKTVSISLPCVTGPYTSVNCTLTLQRSTIRKSPLAASYRRDTNEDMRFSDNFSSSQSIVTSSAQNDSGLFETNLRDERYLPFEGAGVISEWRLQLPGNPAKGEPCQFDYSTISDVILHVRYTAREGGDALRSAALENITALMQSPSPALHLYGSVRLFSVRHEFPSAWAQFKNAPLENSRARLTLDLKAEHYPYWSRGALDETDSITLAGSPMSDLHIYTKEDSLEPIAELTSNKHVSSATNPLPLPTPTGRLELYLSDNQIEELWLAIGWKRRAQPDNNVPT